MARLENEADVDLDGLALEGIGELTAQILEYASSFPLEPRAPRDATLLATHQRLREALLGRGRRRDDRRLDRGRARRSRPPCSTCCGVSTSYERLVADWHLDPDDAIRGATWVIGLVEDAVRSGRRPAP